MVASCLMNLSWISSLFSVRFFRYSNDDYMNT